jgi:hypothetical protein
MKFESADPLSNLKILNVAGELTLSAATLAKVVDFTVSGVLDVTAPDYEKVKTLVVSSDLEYDGAFSALESLTVNAGGEITAAGAPLGPPRASLSR